MKQTSRVLVAGVVGCCVAGCGTSSEDRVLPAATWSRHDAVPAGVSREVSETTSAVGPVCPDPVSGRPSPRGIRLERRPAHAAGAEDRPRLGETLQVCPRGFDPDRALVLTLTRSDGSKTSRNLGPKSDLIASDAGYFASFFLDASWPTGAVSVEARQGSAIAHTSFRIGAPDRRGVRVQAWFGRPALPNPLPIMVAGARPRSTVPIDLYARAQDKQGPFAYATSLRVHTDQRGVGQLRMAYDLTTNGAYELRLRDPSPSDPLGLGTHVTLCVHCCESDPDESGSEYCAN